jgi:uncharacterized membrane protein
MVPSDKLRSFAALGVAALWGFVAVIFVPPIITFDGPSHYFRALQVSEGQVRATVFSDSAVGGTLPGNHVEFVNTLWSAYWGQHDFGSLRRWSEQSRHSIANSSLSRVEFTNTAIYSPVNYAFQALGLRISSMATPSPLVASRMGCLFNLAGYLSLVAGAVGLLPRFKEGALLLATTPLFVIQSASMSADAINFALPLLLLAWIWRLRVLGSKSPWRDITFIFAIGLAIALLKPTSIAIVACVILIPRTCFGGSLIKAVALGLYFLAAVGLWYGWNRANLTIDVARWFDHARPSMALQKAWFLKNPLRFVPVFFHWMRYGMVKEWPMLYANVGGWVPTKLRDSYPWISGVFLVGLIGCPSWEGNADRVWAAGMVLAASGVLLLISVTLFLAYGLAYDPTVPELAGRYLIVPVWCLGAAWGEVSHRQFSHLRSSLFWLALVCNWVGLTAILISIGSRVW